MQYIKNVNTAFYLAFILLSRGHNIAENFFYDMTLDSNLNQFFLIVNGFIVLCKYFTVITTIVKYFFLCKVKVLLNSCISPLGNCSFFNFMQL